MFLPPSKHSQNTFNGYLDNILIVQCTVYIYQGWEFAHRFSERIAHFWWATWAICSWSLIFGERPEQIAHGCSFLVSDLSDSLTSLIFGERPERFAHITQKFAHGRSFVLSDMSESLIVAHLIWAKWANEWMSDERMSKFPALTYIQYNPCDLSCTLYCSC